MRSRSRSRYRGASSHGNASTTCWAVHWAVGCSVMFQVHDTTAVVRQNHEHEKDPERHRRDHKKVQGDQGLHVVLQKGLPRRRRWFLASWAILLHGRFRHINPELPEFSDNPGRAPGGVCLPHQANQGAHLFGKGGPAKRSLLAQAPPVRTEALALPGNHRAGPDEGQGTLPAWPQLGEPGPEHPIRRVGVVGGGSSVCTRRADAVARDFRGVVRPVIGRKR